MNPKILRLVRILILASLTLAAACTTAPEPVVVETGSTALPLGASKGEQPAVRGPVPTPDAGRTLPPLRTESVNYTIQPGDSLMRIAQQYTVAVMSIVEANQIENPDLIEPGEQLVIPPPKPAAPGTNFKIIPDSELVNGPASATFDLETFIEEQGGYLSTYTEEVDGRTMTGAQIVQRIGREYSVGPRILLAIIEYQSGWVTSPEPKEGLEDYPAGLVSEWRKGLYLQLAWTANVLNRGYYLWNLNAIPAYIFSDSTVIPPSPVVNAGTVGVQYLMSLLNDPTNWRWDVGEDGIFNTYLNLFGDPFAYAVEPLVPEGLGQPPMQLPFEEGETWAFTGGPHGGWADGSGWSAIDFGPPGEPKGCLPNDAWVTAVADGPAAYSDNGLVIQDLDGDGFIQTGWTVVYLHIESRDRIAQGTVLKAGDRIGHPSCEGGVADAAHLHLARRYNGEWVSADGPLPFNLDGWISEGDGVEYNGYLKQNGRVVEAWDHHVPENQISR